MSAEPRSRPDLAPLPDDYWGEPAPEVEDPEAIAAGEAAALRAAARDILVPAEPRPTNLQPLPASAAQLPGKLHRHGPPKAQQRTPSRPPARIPSHEPVHHGPVQQSEPHPQGRPPILPAEVLVPLLADHRSRLVTLDIAAKSLAIGAWLVGAVGLSLLLAALVSLFAGTSSAPVVSSVAAVLSGAVALGLAGCMGAGAVGLRHIASTSAQLSAVVEALTQPR